MNKFEIIKTQFQQLDITVKELLKKLQTTTKESNKKKNDGNNV